MLTDRELEALYTRHGVTDQGRRLIAQIRSGRPMRNVDGGGGNYHGRYPSQKMGVTIQWESRYGERPMLLLAEFDPDCHEFYDQARTFAIRYLTTKGRPVGARTTVDYCMLGEQFFGLKDHKTESELLAWNKKMPNRYCRRNDGSWDQPPLREVLHEMGLDYVLATSRTIPHTFARNLNIVGRYFKATAAEIPTANECSQSLIGVLTNARYVTLMHAIGILGSADHLYWGFIRGDWYLDPWNEVLAEPDAAYVYLDHSACESRRALLNNRVPLIADSPLTLPEEGEQIIWDGVSLQVLNRGDTGFFLQRSNNRIQFLDYSTFRALRAGPRPHIRLPEASASAYASEAGVEIWRSAKQSNLSNALTLLKVLQRFWRGEQIPESEMPARTLRFWEKRYRDAERLYANGLVGLVQRDDRKGNSTSRIEPAHETLLRRFLENDATEPSDETITTTYGRYRDHAAQEGFSPVREEAFMARRKLFDAHARTEAKQGKRMGYKSKPPVDANPSGEPPEGDRPWLFSHLDETQSDVFVRLRNRVVFVGRPWLSLLIDSFDRLVLALFLCFQRPSHVSVFMTLRECVRRHGRLPAAIVTDEGRWFQGTKVQTLLAQRGVEHIIRPKGEPRYGNPVERLNLNINNWMSRSLEGSNFTLKNPRESSRTHDPRRLAKLNLPQFAQKCEELLYDEYPTLFHSKLGCTPQEKLSEGLLLTGERPDVPVLDVELFTFQTLIESKRHRGTIDVRSGVRVNGYDYYDDDFRSCVDETLRSKPLFDFEDPSYIWVNFRGRQLRCDLIGSQVSRLAKADRRYEMTERLAKLAQEDKLYLASLQQRGGLLNRWRKEARNESAPSDSAPPIDDASPPPKRKPTARVPGIATKDIPPAPIADDEVED